MCTQTLNKFLHIFQITIFSLVWTFSTDPCDIITRDMLTAIDEHTFLNNRVKTYPCYNYSPSLPYQ